MTGDDLLRVYFDPDEIGPDGYPFVWHRPGEQNGQPSVEVAVKDLIREQAGNRCERCGHPYVKGQGLNDGWSACDERCTHHGPIRYRDAHLGEHDEWRVRAVIHETAAEARLDELPHGTGVRWDIEAAWRILTVHHLNGVKHDCRWWNLAALCQRCHLTIQAKVYLDRPWNRPHTEWFKPHAAGFYAAADAERFGDPELSRAEVLASMDTILAIHATQGSLLAADLITEYAYLIERVHEGSPVWMRHDATWTSDATEARRFVSQEEAGRVIAATRSEARVVEHGFSCEARDA